MALLFCDSFDHYTTFPSKGWTYTGDGYLTIGAYGRNGTNGVRTNNQRVSIIRDLPASKTIFVGSSFKFDAVTSPVCPIFTFWDVGTIQISLRLNPDGSLTVFGNGTTLYTSATGRMTISQTYYLEFGLTIDPSVGMIEIRLNGEVLVSLPNLDTQTTANSSVNRFQIAAWDAHSIGMSFDDLYICDDNGSAPNNYFLGDVRVQSIFPNGVGATDGAGTSLMGSDSNKVGNYLLVDEVTPDTADYVQSKTIDDKDTYAFSNLANATGTVFGVQILPHAAKSDAGARSIVSVAHITGTSPEEVDSANHVLTVTPTYFLDIMEAKPGGGVWTISDVNGAEFGVKVAS